MLGRALQAGDRLPLMAADNVVTRCGWHLVVEDAGSDPRRMVRVLPGPHVERFSPDALADLCAQPWRVSAQSDRMGYRLLGPPLRHVGQADVASLGLPLGAIQVPGDGQPIVLLADHQPTGGYTVLATVIRADLEVLAQRAPGDEVQFTPVSRADALTALAAGRANIRAVSPDAAAWTNLRWAESGGGAVAGGSLADR
jgi:allophanate hydrolase subunit 2